MSLELETLREERDEYKGKVEIQMKKIGHNSVCGRCSMERTNAPQIAVPSKPKTRRAPLSFLSTPFFQFKSLSKPGSSRRVDLALETNSRRPGTDHPVQKVPSHAVANCSAANFADSQTAALPRCIADRNEERDCLIDFNNTTEKKLDVELAHTLDHGRSKCVKFSRDGKYLASGCNDGKAYIYDVQAGTLICVLRNLLREDSIEAVCFSHDGKYLVTGSWLGEIFVWEISTKYVRNAFKGHTRYTRYILSLDLSSNGRLLVSTSGDNTVRVWNMRDGATKLLTERNRTVLDYLCYAAVFSPDGSYIASSHGDGIVRMWDARTSQLLRRVKAHRWVGSVAFMPDGKGFLSRGENRLRYWDVSSLDFKRFHGRSQATELNAHGSTLGLGEPAGLEREFGDVNERVSFFALSSDGRWVASGSRDANHASTVRIWDTRNGVTQCILNHGSKVYSVDFSPAGRYLASGGGYGILKIWRYSEIPRQLGTIKSSFGNT